QLSQFWYNDETARALAEEAVRQTDGLIVCVSSPSIFLMLKKMRVPNPLLLLEFDTRFAVFKDEFRHYDYNCPLEVVDLDGSLRGAGQVIIVDPPFLAEECFVKTSKTVRRLAADNARFLVCTGECWVMRNVVRQELDARLTAFHPCHRGGLANDFRCYTNYQSSADAFHQVSDDDTSHAPTGETD
ncbi:putative N6-adenine methyltransferase-domain-containing protein, partial [Thamnocephalis sphaerospora]